MQANVRPLEQVVLSWTLPFKLCVSRWVIVKFHVVLAMYWSCVTGRVVLFWGIPIQKGCPKALNKRYEKDLKPNEKLSASQVKCEGALQTERW